MSIPYRLLIADDRRPAVLDDAELTELYRHPDPGDRAWVRTNFVSTLDGAVQGADGRAGSISTASDLRVFALQRALSDVILVGAGTVRAEQYRAVDLEPWQRTLRAELGLDPFPTLAIVSASCDLAADIGTAAGGAGGPVLIMTTEESRGARPDFSTGQVEIVELGAGGSVPLPDVITELSRRGLRRVLSEGGPKINWELHAAGLVDEICLTVSPMIIGGDGSRSTSGSLLDKESFRLGHVVSADDGALLLRYLR